MSKKEEQLNNQEVKEVVKEEPVKEEIKYNDDLLKQIEDNRLKFYKRYRIGSIFKWPVAALSIGALVFAFFAVPSFIGDNNSLKMGLMIGIAALSLITMVTYTLISKFMLNKRSKNYFADYYDLVSNYTLDNKNIKDVDCVAARKIERIEFDENLLFKDVDMVGSRALTTFKYKDHDISLCDLAAQVRVDRRPRPVFVGKYVIAPSKYDVDDPIFVYIKGDAKKALPPTNMEGYKTVLDDDKIAIYSNNGKWNKLVTSKVKSALLSLKEGDNLIDIAIAFRPGKMFVCMGYDDSLMILPLEKAFDPKPTEEYKVELHKLLKLIGEINE